MKTRKRTRIAGVFGAGATIMSLVASALALSGGSAQAASSGACTNGGFSLVNLATGATVAAAGTDRIRASIPDGQFGTPFAVRGRYAQFDVRSADFAVLNQAFTGAANPLDMTGGRFTPVFAIKVPNHRGLVL